MIEKEVVGYVDGGLNSPPKVKEVDPAINSVPKQFCKTMVLVPVFFDKVQEVVVKEAVLRTTVPKVMVLGKMIVIFPPDGIGSINCKVNT